MAELKEDWHVYIVRCADGSLYTGVARALAARIAAHNAGRGAKYTRARRPVELVYAEGALDRAAALKREIKIKRLTADAKRRLVRDAPHSPSTKRLVSSS